MKAIGNGIAGTRIARFLIRRRLSYWVSLLLLLGIFGVTASSSNLLAQGNWEARYWNNRTLTGNPVLIRQEAGINNDWGGGSPAPQVFTDNFSAEWRQTANLQAGTYRFTATTDDGMRVLVNGNTVIDSWYDSQVHTVTADVTLNTGNHNLVVQYYEGGGVATAKLTYGLVTPVPPANVWRGEYFNNTSLSGAPVLVRDDAHINFNWGFGSPGANVAADFFSVRWTRQVSFNPGRYRCTVVSDDGVRFYINNNRLIDQWRVQAAATYTTDVDLAGSVNLVTEYFENTERAEIRVTCLPIGTTPPPGPTGAWYAEYFNNTALAGTPILVQNDPVIDFNWGSGSPGRLVNPDQFSVRWTTNINISAPGRYRFTARTDDGVRVYVNNQLLIDAWFDHAVQSFSGEVNLGAGSIPVRVEYYENTGLAEAHLNWSLVSGTGGQYPGTAVVTSYRLNVRTGPGTNFAIITKLNTGDVVSLAGYRNADGSWVQVALPNGTVGWASTAYLRTSIPVSSLPILGGTGGQPPANANAVVTASFLNVRFGPGVSFGILTAITNGTTVRMIGRNGDGSWVKIILPDGRQGWTNSFYLSSSFSIGNLPFVNI